MQLPHTYTHSVNDGICDCRANWHHGRLTHTLRAEGAKGGGDFNENGRNVRHILNVRQSIIHEGGCEQLAILVVNKPFEKCPAKSLHDATINLSLDLRRIDREAYILHGNIIEYAHLARLGIDRYFRHMHTEHRRAGLDSGTATPIHGFVLPRKRHRLSGNLGQFNTLARSTAYHYFVTFDLQVGH